MKTLTVRIILVILLATSACTVHAQSFLPGQRAYAHYFLDQNGKLYTWGGVMYGAADSIFHSPTTDPIEVKHPTDKKWTKAVDRSTTSEGIYSFLLDETGDLYKASTKVEKFISFDGEHKWKDAASSHETYALVSGSGKLYYQGSIYQRTASTGQSVGYTKYDTLTLMPSAPDGSQWQQVSVEHSHFAATTTNGNIYSFGENYFGQHGYGDTTFHPEPVPFLHPNIEDPAKWSKVAVRNGATLALDEHGDLYFSGAMLTRPDSPFTAKPQIVQNPKGEKWADVQSQGTLQIVGLTREGSLFVWGRYEPRWGPFGPGRYKYATMTVPEEVPIQDSVTRWTSIAMLRTGSFAVDDKCRVWGWGENPGAALGVPQSVLYEIDTPIFVHRFCQTPQGTVSGGEKNGSLSLQNVTLIPNPASLSVRVEFSLAKNEVITIELFDMLGKSVYSTSLQRYEAGLRSVTIPLDGFPSGSYILRMQTPSGRVSKTLVVE